MDKSIRAYKGFAANLLAPLVLLITSPVIARILGPEGRGEMAYVLSVLVLLDYIALGGATNYLLVESKTDSLFAQKLMTIDRHLLKTTIFASVLSIFFASRFLNVNVETFCFVVILLNSFQSARNIELKKVRAVINSDWKTLNRERIFIPLARLSLTIMALFLNITSPLVFVSLQVFSGIAVSQYCFRKYPILKLNLNSKSSNLLIKNYFIWSILENVGYWGVILLIGNLIPTNEFGIFAIALVAGEVILNIEKFMVKHQTSIHVEEFSKGALFSNRNKELKFSAFILFLLSYTLIAYFSIPIVFGSDFSGAAFPAIICISASSLRLLLRMRNYSMAQKIGKRTAVTAEFTIVSSGILLCSILLIFPTAIAASIVVLASVFFGTIFTFMNRVKL